METKTNRIRIAFANAADVKALKDAIRTYNKAGRWTKKAEDLLTKAFPNAYWNENVGLNKGLSGTVRIEDCEMFVHACNYLVKAKSGYNYNRSRAWVIPIN